MTEERITLIEKYLGSREKTGLLVSAWHELRGALSNLHASLTLAHCTPDQVKERERILDEKSQAFASALFNMNVELGHVPNVDVHRLDMTQANEPVDWPAVELGGEG
jgi:cytosine/adenosine deaminase-related metal-dependent hydrolase